MTPECEECGNDLHVNTVDKPHIDWVKVVCSDCGNITNVSMIRLASTVKKEEK
jgi:DNA-directed RNA polymerase subunit M/transcription elongation factor TFIIS